MYNENKVVTAGADGFTVYFIDSRRHFHYEYHQPLLPHLQKLQLFGDSYKGKNYQQFEQDVFNSYQNRLYKNAVYGLASYDLLQLQKMNLREKLEIKRIHRLTQHVLNLWKQEIVSKLVDEFLLSVFHKSKSVKELVASTDHYTNLKEMNGFEFAELNISKADIALKLIEQNILPANFFRMAA